ncbi:MAG: hypothetical protein ACLFWL_17725 [Candidatus Brocadiia bacterium]
MENSKIYEKVKMALLALYREDIYLLERDVNERSLSHKLAEHMQKEFGNSWDVDCEYNRHVEEPKKLFYDGYGDIKCDVRDTDAKTVYPDIVVHKRGNDKHNLLVIEIKKTTSEIGDEKDEAKLAAFTGEQYDYRVGLFLKFDVDNGCIEDVQCFQEGELTGECDDLKEL